MVYFDRICIDIPVNIVQPLALVTAFFDGRGLAEHQSGWSWSVRKMLKTLELHSICDFQKSGIVTSVDSDEHVQPPFKLRNTKGCPVSSLTLIDYSSD